MTLLAASDFPGWLSHPQRIPEAFKQRSRLVGACVYCGQTSGLSKEHVLSEGLGGHRTLLAASCDRHRKITSQFERQVLRGLWEDARTITGLKKDGAPAELILRLRSEDGAERVEQVPVDSASTVLLVPALPRASELPAQAADLADFAYPVHRDHRKLVERLGEGTSVVTQIQIDEVLILNLARFVAKTAYCYYVFCCGLCPLDEVPVLELINGKDNNWRPWVGSTAFVLEEDKIDEVQHTFGTFRGTDSHGRTIDLVRLKLFGSVRTWGYEVVVRRGAAPNTLDR